MNNIGRKAFTILEIIITIVFVVIVTAPILNTFQLSERLSEKSRRGFIAQNLAREMMAEISKKSFSDPDGPDTFEAGLLPGPTHEEYAGDLYAGRIANGTDEVTGEPRMMNETIVNRAKFYDDIDDYDGYNTDETILPTDASGREFIYGGGNVNEKFRVKVKVSSDAAFSGEPYAFIDTAEVIGASSAVLAATRDSKYLLLTDPATNLTEIYNARTGARLDNQPNSIAPYAYGDGTNTQGSDPVSLKDLRDTPFEIGIEGEPLSHIYPLGPAAKTIIGPAGDRFYTLHRADINDDKLFSAVSAVDMNAFNTPEVSFHKLDDINLVANGLRSNSINAVTVDSKFNVYAATNGAGLMVSDDNGETWSRVGFLKTDDTPVTRVNCLAATQYSERFLNRSVVLAGGDGGLLIIENNSKKTYRDANISDSQNVTAIAVAENGYTVAGLDDGSIYVSKCFAMEYGKNDSSMSRKKGPEPKKVNALAIDDNYRVWLGNESGQYYSDDAFLNLSGDDCTWNAFTSETGVNAIHIDRSRSMPAPFVDVPAREAPGIKCAPSLLADDNGLHLFYLDDSTDGGNGNSLANTKLWYMRSADFGKSWSEPVRVCHTPAGESAWAHSETIDAKGSIHAVWQSKLYRNEWNILYQRSDDCGKKWLAEDRCAFNQFGEKPLHSYGYKTGFEADWVKFGAGKLSRIGASANGTLYCVASASDMHPYHYSFLSPSGGKNWSSDYVMSVFKPSDMPVGYTESINVLSEKNKMFNVATIGPDYSMRVFFEAELYAREARINVNSFQLTNVIASAPPAFNEALNLLYSYCRMDASGEITLNSLVSYYPYYEFKNTKVEISPDQIFSPQMLRNNAYLFFGMKADASLKAADGATGRFFMVRSDDCGNNYSSPIFVDYLYGAYDQPASARYGPKIYIIKKNVEKSPRSGFALSSIPAQLAMCGSDSAAFSFDCDMAPLNAADNYELGAKVNAISGDDDGNLLCATSDGLYVRNIKNANAVIDYSNYGPQYKKGFVLFPLRLTKHETFSDPGGRKIGWLKFFDGVHVTGVHAEKGGTYWAATLKNGLYRSVDYGASWTHIEAKLSNIVDISRIERGKASELNKINLITRRFNAADASRRLVMETLLIIYNLSNNAVESFSVLASEEMPDPLAAGTKARCCAAASADNSRIFFYNPSDSMIYYKKPDYQYKNFLQLFKVYPVHDIFSKLDAEVEKNDVLELSFAGRLKADDCKFSFLPAPMAHLSLINEGTFINSFELKLNESVSEIDHFYSAAQDSPAVPFIRLKSFTENSDTGGEASYIIEANFSADINLKKSPRKLSVPALSGVSKLVCGPDGDTLYALSESAGMVYRISGIKEMTNIQLTQYSRNMNNPSDVLFSPFASGAHVKAYIRCRDNIVELNGDPLISSPAPYEIAGAVLTDNNELLFYDSLTKNIYKCPRSSHKTVLVSVVYKDDGALVSTPPVNIAKKFFSRDYSDLPSASRKYIKYNYIYTSRDFPDGITPESPQRWKPASDSDETVFNVYIVDTIFDINGEFYVDTGMAIKFATADKKKYPGDFSGRSPASMRRTGGRMIVSGDVNKSVLLTSLDDPSIPPSIYNAPDGEYMSSFGLPNIQIRMSKYDPPLYDQIGGVRYGDWGASDGTAAGSHGGLYVANGVDNSFMLNHASARYGLLYGRHIYTYSLMPFNINDYETAWNKTNVYVVDNASNFILKNCGSLRIGQGSIIKIDTGSSFTVEGKHDEIFPHCTFISDGSPYAPVVFSPLGLAGSREGKTPRAGVALDWYKIVLDGTAEIANIRNTELKTIAELDFNGSDAYLNGCDISGMVIGAGAQTSIDFMNNSGVKFNNGQFSIWYPGDITTADMSATRFSKSDFNFTYTGGQGTPEQAFYYNEIHSTTIFDSNNFYDGYLSASARTNRFSGSKIRLNSVAYFDGNFFLNSDQPVPPDGGASCEISVINVNREYGFSVCAWPFITNNYFLNSRLPIYLEGFTDSGILKNKIRNNYFINAGAIAASNNSTAIASALTRTVEPQKAAVDSDGFLYILDKKAGAYYKFNRNGNIVMRVSMSGRGNGELYSPAALAVNMTGEVYVADNGNQRIQKYDRYGNFLLKFGQFGSGEGMLTEPSAMAVATVNNSEVLLIADKGRNRLLKFSNEGVFIEEIEGGLNGPADIATSPDQKFAYVVDSLNNRVVKVQLNIGEYKTEKFSITVKAYSASSSEPGGFAVGNSAAEGEYFEVNVTAKNSDGSVNIDYKPRYGGKISAESAGGEIIWEGQGITDNSKSASDNGAAFEESAFSRGSAKFYARCASAGGPVRITAADNAIANLAASAVIEWTPEIVPWGLIPAGTNAGGFRRYSARNDPEVKFIKIPGSNFERGDEKHTGGFSEIKMSAYYIAETPVTNAQFNRWRSFSQDPPALGGSWKWSASDAPAADQCKNYPGHPAVGVSYDDAKNYCFWLLRGSNSAQTDAYLPSEAQYEKAMRGGGLNGLRNSLQDKAYPWGNSFLADLVNSRQTVTSDERPLDGAAGTTPALKYPPQGFYGLYDICGNAYSWCRDWFAGQYQGTRINPVNLIISEHKVIRGGSWKENDGFAFRCSAREYAMPGFNFNDVGFRPCFGSNK